MTRLPLVSTMLAMLACAVVIVNATAPSAQTAPQSKPFPLDSVSGLTLHGVQADAVEHRGQKAVRLQELNEVRNEAIAILNGVAFTDGVIEVEVAGAPRAGAPEGSRGFIGIAFRVRPDAARMECFYLRPTNGRADDQLRRNHSTQYVSSPEFPWERLRKERPGVYESYVDLAPGVWTRMRIVVNGVKARLHVHGADQPALIVNDLKLGTEGGGVALWIGQGTEGHFSNLRITPTTSSGH